MSVQELPSQQLMSKISPQTIDLVTSVYGNCPAWFMKANFDAMAPVHHALDKYVGLYRSKDQKGYAEMFELFERWMNSDVPMAGQIFKEMAGDVSRQNLIMKNQMPVGSRRPISKTSPAPSSTSSVNMMILSIPNPACR